MSWLEMYIIGIMTTMTIYCDCSLHHHLLLLILYLSNSTKISTNIGTAMEKELAWSLDRVSWPSSAKYCLSFKRITILTHKTSLLMNKFRFAAYFYLLKSPEYRFHKLGPVTPILSENWSQQLSQKININHTSQYFKTTEY